MLISRKKCKEYDSLKSRTDGCCRLGRWWNDDGNIKCSIRAWEWISFGQSEGRKRREPNYDSIEKVRREGVIKGWCVDWLCVNVIWHLKSSRQVSITSLERWLLYSVSVACASAGRFFQRVTLEIVDIEVLQWIYRISSSKRRRVTRLIRWWSGADCLKSVCSVMNVFPNEPVNSGSVCIYCMSRLDYRLRRLLRSLSYSMCYSWWYLQNHTRCPSKCDQQLNIPQFRENRNIHLSEFKKSVTSIGIYQ